MTGKEWLKQGLNLQREIDELTQRLEKAQKEYGVKNGEITPVSATFDERVTLHYQEQIQRKITQKQAVLDDILKAIEKVENPLYRTILTARYVNGKTLQQIADEQYYSLRAISYLMKEAQKAIEKN